MSKSVTYTFDMSVESYTRLKESAEEEHRTIAGQLRLIVDKYFESIDKKSRRSSD